MADDLVKKNLYPMTMTNLVNFIQKEIIYLKKTNVLTATVCVAKNLMKKTQVLVRVYSTDYQRPCDLPPILSK